MALEFGKQLRLTQGPSREELFDALRLQGREPSLSIIEFWCKEEYADDSRSGSSLPVQITGLHIARNNGREWFFWGTLKPIIGGSTIPFWMRENVCHVFGRWNTHFRRGQIILSEESAFVNMLKEE